MSLDEMLSNKEELKEIGSILSTIESSGIVLSDFDQGVLFQMLSEAKKEQQMKGV